MKDMFGEYLTAFPDIKTTVQEMIAERDLVVARFTVEATHKGEIYGTPATGKRIAVNGIDILRIKDGRVSEAWHQGDDLVALMQIGVKLPMPAQHERAM
jgi:predicted ester cyclase